MLKFILRWGKETFAVRVGSISDYLFALLGATALVCGHEIYERISPNPEAELLPEGLKRIHDVITGPQDVSFLVVLASICIISPIIEELIFRGLFWKICKRAINEHYAFFITSILFAAAHGDPAHIIAVFPMGLLAGWLRLRSGSIFPPMIAHILNNSIVSYFLVVA